MPASGAGPAVGGTGRAAGLTATSWAARFGRQIQKGGSEVGRRSEVDFRPRRAPVIGSPSAFPRRLFGGSTNENSEGRVRIWPFLSDVRRNSANVSGARTTRPRTGRTKPARNAGIPSARTGSVRLAATTRTARSSRSTISDACALVGGAPESNGSFGAIELPVPPVYPNHTLISI